MCDKVKIFAKRQAIKVAIKMKENGKVPARDYLRAYYCKECKAWHLTRQSLEEYWTKKAKHELDRIKKNSGRRSN